MSVKATTGVKVGFKYPNKYITPGLVTDLWETLNYMAMEDAVEFMKNLKCEALECFDERGGSYNIEDLAEMFGPHELAFEVEPIWFYGGPEKTYQKGLSGCMDHRFTLMKGSALTFVLDTILYQVSKHGYAVFRDLSIPL